MSQKSIRSGASDTSTGQHGTQQLFTEVGTYNNMLVAILRVNKTHVNLTRTDLKELKEVTFFFSTYLV